jgi:hypothetical protein
LKRMLVDAKEVEVQRANEERSKIVQMLGYLDDEGWKL